MDIDIAKLIERGGPVAVVVAFAVWKLLGEAQTWLELSNEEKRLRIKEREKHLEAAETTTALARAAHASLGAGGSGDVEPVSQRGARQAVPGRGARRTFDPGSGSEA